MMRGGHGGPGGPMGRMNDTTISAKPKITRNLLKRVWRYARPYRSLIMSMLAITLATAGLGLLTPLIIET